MATGTNFPAPLQSAGLYPIVQSSPVHLANYATGSIPSFSNTDLPAGTLIYDSSLNVVKVNTGSAYVIVGAGSVTSVGMTVPSSVLSVSPSTITTSGTFAVTLATQAKNLVWSGPATGVDATPTFRAIVTADLPDTGIVDGSYGDATHSVTLSLDAKGRCYGVTAPAIAISESAVTFATEAAHLFHVGPTTGVPATPTWRAMVAADLPATAVSANSYGDASHVANFTVDAQGRLTAAASTAIAIADSAITYASQAANKFLASPSGGAGAPTYRVIASADLPGGVGTVSSIIAGTGLSGGTITSTGTIAVNYGTSSITACVGNDTRLPPTPSSIGAIVYDNGSGYSSLSDVAVGSYLRSGGLTTAPLWSTLTLPNAATTGDILYASGTNVIGRLADVATNQVLLSGGVGVAPAWGTVGNSALTNSTITFASGTGTTASGSVSLGGSGSVNVTYGTSSNTATQGNDTRLPPAPSTQGRLLYDTGSAWTALATGTAGQLLRTGGAAANPAWSTPVWPNAATTGDLVYASGTSTYGQLAVGTANQVLIGGSTPSWGTAPNAALTNSSIVFANGTGITGGATVSLGGTYTPAVDQSFSPTWTGTHTFSTHAVTISGVGGSFALSPGATTGTPAAAFTLTTPAHTALTASTEFSTFKVTAATQQFATGAITVPQRFSVINAPTYGAVGASTITNAATLAISGAPIAGTNATLSNSQALWVQSGATRLDGGVYVGSNGANQALVIGPGTVGNTASATTLSDNTINNTTPGTVATITVGTTTGWASTPGVMLCGTELISYSAIGGSTTVTGCVRGAYGTTIAAHASGATIANINTLTGTGTVFQTSDVGRMIVIAGVTYYVSLASSTSVISVLPIQGQTPVAIAAGTAYSFPALPKALTAGGGGIRAIRLPVPTVSYTNVGATGSSVHKYVVVGVDAFGGRSVSATLTTASSNATLDGTNYVQLTITNASGNPYVSYDVTRTQFAGATTAGTVGAVYTVTPSSSPAINVTSGGTTTTVNDQSVVAGPYTTPLYNSTGDLVIDGCFGVSGTYQYPSDTPTAKIVAPDGNTRLDLSTANSIFLMNTSATQKFSVTTTGMAMVGTCSLGASTAITNLTDFGTGDIGSTTARLRYGYFGNLAVGGAAAPLSGVDVYGTGHFRQINGGTTIPAPTLSGASKTGGTTTYSYYLSYKDASGNVLGISATATTTTGTSTITSLIVTQAATIPGAFSYDVIRSAATGGGVSGNSATTGSIFTAVSPSTLAKTDVGGAATTYTLPTPVLARSADVIFDGAIVHTGDRLGFFGTLSAQTLSTTLGSTTVTSTGTPFVTTDTGKILIVNGVSYTFTYASSSTGTVQTPMPATASGLAYYLVPSAAQGVAAGDVTGFVAGGGTAATSSSTWDGTVGSSHYTVGDIVTALKKYGLLAV